MATINIGDDYELVEEGDDFVIRHVPSSDEFRYDAFDGEWQPDPPLAGGAGEGSIDEWVDVVAEGVDNSGETDVTGDIESLIADGRVLWFRPGEYLVNGQISYSTPGARIAFVGIGAATIACDDTSVEDGVLDIGSDSNMLERVEVRNLTFDMSEDGVGRGVMRSYASRILYEDIDVQGQLESSNHYYSVYGKLDDDDDIGVFRRVRMPDGATIDSSGSGDQDQTGISPRGAGTFRLEDCHVEGFPDNGVYADGPRIIVSGGIYRDNGGANIRFGASDSRVENAQSEYTEAFRFADERSARCIFAWKSQASRCSVIGTTMHLGHEDARAIRVRDDFGSLRIDNCDIVADGSSTWMLLIDEDDGYDGGDTKVRISNTNISGTYGGDRIAHVSSTRDVLWENCQVEVEEASSGSLDYGFSPGGDERFLGTTIVTPARCIRGHSDSHRTQVANCRLTNTTGGNEIELDGSDCLVTGNLVDNGIDVTDGTTSANHVI